MATVITSMLSAVPWIGGSLTEFVWGGFSVSNATINRFFALHYLLPFVLAALAVIHMLTLHSHGSGNPLGISSNVDKLVISPYFIFKDAVTLIFGLGFLVVIVFWMPNLIGHADNYIEANPLQTPPSIVPEWYLTWTYAALRSVPNKLGGVIAILGCILVMLTLPILDTSRIRGGQFRPLYRIAFWALVVDFVILEWIGMNHAEAPFIIVGQIATIFWFSWFLVIIPVIGIIENILADIAIENKNS